MEKYVVLVGRATSKVNGPDRQERRTRRQKVDTLTGRHYDPDFVVPLYVRKGLLVICVVSGA